MDAALRLQLGDADGYRRDCRQMLRHFVTSNDPVVADKTAKTCLLLPDVVADLKPVLQLAERAVAGTQQHPAYRWFLICKALADYRTLRFVAAINSIQKVDPKSEGGVLDATAYLILALSEQRRGRFVEARQAFTRAQALRERHWPQPEQNSYFDTQWDDWLRYDVLRREAEKLLEGKKTEPMK